MSMKSRAFEKERNRQCFPFIHVDHVAESTFKYLFPADHNYKNLRIEQPCLINYTMYYISNDFNNNIFSLFDCNEILCRPFMNEMHLGYNCTSAYFVPDDVFDSFSNKTYDPNKFKFEPEKYYPETEDVIEAIYLKLRSYIYRYINERESYIVENISLTKINNRFMSLQSSHFRQKLERIYLEAYQDEDSYSADNKMAMAKLLFNIDVPTICFTQTEDEYRKIEKQYKQNIHTYAIKLLTAISEKLYYLILTEVKRILEENGIIDSTTQSTKEIKLLQSNIYDECSINSDFFEFQKIIEEMKKVDTGNQSAATDEQHLLELEADVINLYNALDIYNKDMVNLFVQTILKYKNSVLQ